MSAEIIPVAREGGESPDENYATRLKCTKRLAKVLDDYSGEITFPVMMDMMCSGVMDICQCGNDPEKFRDIKSSLMKWVEMWVHTG